MRRFLIYSKNNHDFGRVKVGKYGEKRKKFKDGLYSILMPTRINIQTLERGFKKLYLK